MGVGIGEEFAGIVIPIDRETKEGDPAGGCLLQAFEVRDLALANCAPGCHADHHRKIGPGGRQGEIQSGMGRILPLDVSRKRRSRCQGGEGGFPLGGILPDGDHASSSHGFHHAAPARRPLYRDFSRGFVGADPDWKEEAVLGCETVATPQFTAQSQLAGLHQHVCAIAIPDTPPGIRLRALVPANQAHVNCVSGSRYFVPEQLQLWFVGVGESDVGPAVPIVIEVDEGAAVSNAVQATDPGDIGEAPAAPVMEDTVQFTPAERMAAQDLFAVHLGIGVQHPGHVAIDPGIDVLFGESFLQVVIGAHDRAPEVTSQVHLGGGAGGRSVESVGNVEVQESVVVEVTELAAP